MNNPIKQQSVTDPRYGVIVVGARCAGSTAATVLARAGRRVLLVDRDRFPSRTFDVVLSAIGPTTAPRTPRPNGCLRRAGRRCGPTSWHTREQRTRRTTPV